MLLLTNIFIVNIKEIMIVKTIATLPFISFLLGCSCMSEFVNG